MKPFNKRNYMEIANDLNFQFASCALDIKKLEEDKAMFEHMADRNPYPGIIPVSRWVLPTYYNAENERKRVSEAIDKEIVGIQARLLLGTVEYQLSCSKQKLDSNYLKLNRLRENGLLDETLLKERLTILDQRLLEERRKRAKRRREAEEIS